MRQILLSALLMAGSIAVANETAAHGAQEHGVPFKLILVQAGNLAILVGILVYLFRVKVAIHFQQRAQSYRDLVSRAEKTRAEAESRKNEIELRLRQLETGAEEQRRKIQTETAQLKAQIIGDAKRIADGLVQDGRRLVALEVEKAKGQMRQEMLGLALEGATATLNTKVGDPERKRLQSEFVERIQVIR